MKPKNFFNDKLTRQAPDAISPAPVVPAADPVPEGPDLSFVPADFHVDGKPDLSKFTAHYQDLVAADAQRREALAGVPEDGNYAFALPDDLSFEGLDLPEGFSVELMTESEVMKPLFSEMGALLKELGAPAGAATKAAGLIAKYEAVKAAQDFAAWREDMKALGPEPTAVARTQAVQRKLESVLPADQVKALFSGERISAKGIQALEKLLAPRNLTTPTPTPQGQDLEGLPAYERLKIINAKAS